MTSSGKNPGRNEIKARKSPGLNDRLDAAAKAKQAMLERFRSKSEGAAGKDQPGESASKNTVPAKAK